MNLSTLFNIVLASAAAIVSGATITTNNEGGGLRRNLSGIGYSTCLDEHSCQAQAKRDGVVHFHTGDYPDYGCFSKNGKYFWGHGGTYEQQSDHELAGIKKRVYCAEYSARGYDDDDDDWHGDEHHDDDDDWHGVGDDHYYYDTSEWRSASHHSWSKSSKSTSWSSSGKSGKSGSKSSKSWWGHWDDDNWSGDGWLSHSKSSKASYHSAKSSKSSYSHHSAKSSKKSYSHHSTKWSKPSSHSKHSYSKSRTSQGSKKW